jgi:hypothetical protein
VISLAILGLVVARAVNGSPEPAPHPS